MKYPAVIFLFFSLLVCLSAQEMDELRDDLTEASAWAIGRTTLPVGGKTYILDCSGVMYAIADKAGVDLQSLILEYAGNGVTRIYRLLEDRELLTSEPRPGDLIFWDNSYDSNGNGKCDDWLTHVGIISRITEDGLIYFIHYNYSRGIVEEMMDPADPDNRERNSAMRARSDGLTDTGGWSAAHLLRGYGDLSGLIKTP